MKIEDTEDLCLTCVTKKIDCHLAQGIAKAYACVSYEDKNKIREDLIKKIDEIIPRDDSSKITWKQLCSKTDFDSVVTALAYGLNWNENIKDIKDSVLKMIIFNIEGFPFGSRFPDKLKRKV